MIELVPYVIGGPALGGILVKGHNVHNRLRVALLVHRCDSIFTEDPLPLGRKALLNVSIKLFSPGWQRVGIEDTDFAHGSIVSKRNRDDLSVFDLR